MTTASSALATLNRPTSLVRTGTDVPSRATARNDVPEASSRTSSARHVGPPGRRRDRDDRQPGLRGEPAAPLVVDDDGPDARNVAVNSRAFAAK